MLRNQLLTNSGPPHHSLGIQDNYGLEPTPSKTILFCFILIYFILFYLSYLILSFLILFYSYSSRLSSK